MDKDLAGQDAKELYDVSKRACQSLQMVFLYLTRFSIICNQKTSNNFRKTVFLLNVFP